MLYVTAFIFVINHLWHGKLLHHNASVPKVNGNQHAQNGSGCNGVVIITWLPAMVVTLCGRSFSTIESTCLGRCSSQGVADSNYVKGEPC